ncbi:hypothetical protein SAMN05421854_1011682 [Amycolatopsis rubida]|uniref:Alpha/beta hydrolase n=1 Tax=Amycolatopsis rubida TaxID=112413 RepID=A0A1I5GLI1_9PSEU|nr:hypothetical protein SAMN05421854_1011682 [Amycolatopsis rubida]
MTHRSAEGDPVLILLHGTGGGQTICSVWRAN